MAVHEPGQKPNGQLRAPSPVGRAAPPVVKAGSAPTAPKSTPTRGFGSPGIPSFDDDPIGAISFALREVGAALQGKELPSEKARAAGFKQQSQRLEMTNTRFKILKEGAGILKNLPIEQHEDFLATIRIPEIKEMLQAASEGILENFEENLVWLGDHPGALIDISDIAQAVGSTPKEINDRVDAYRKADLEIDAARQKEAIKAEFREPKALVTRSGLGGANIDINTGEVVTAGSLSVIDQKTGKSLTIPIRTREELDDALDRLASGEIVEGRIRRTLEITDIPGAVRMLLPDLPAGMTPEQARLKGINIDLSDKTLEGLLESKGDVEQLDRVFTEIQGIIAETPAALGTAGFIARTGNTIMAQLPLISTLVGVEFDPELLVTENYESTFREIGVESQRLKSATVGAAYALALAQRRRGGRMAQQDVERALAQVTGQDPKATIQVLQDLKERTAEGFQTRAKNMLGRRPPRIEVTPSPALSKSGLIPEGVVVPEGHEFVRMQDGKVVIRNKSGEEFIQE